MSKKLILVALLLAVSLGASAWWFWWPAYQAKQVVRAHLNDPSSAMFSDVSFNRSTGGTCGVVNAKNRMGGFVGDTRFALSKEGDLRFDDDEIEKRIEFLKFAVTQCK